MQLAGSAWVGAVTVLWCCCSCCMLVCSFAVFMGSALWLLVILEELCHDGPQGMRQPPNVPAGWLTTPGSWRSRQC